MTIKDLLTVQRVNYLSDIRIRYDFDVNGFELFLYKNIDSNFHVVNGGYNLRVFRKYDLGCILEKDHLEKLK